MLFTSGRAKGYRCLMWVPLLRIGMVLPTFLKYSIMDESFDPCTEKSASNQEWRPGSEEWFGVLLQHYKISSELKTLTEESFVNHHYMLYFFGNNILPSMRLRRPVGITKQN